MSANILSLCRTYGPMLHLESSIDGARLMAAIAGCESSFGRDTTPRYEPSYDIGGSNYRNEQIELIAYYAGRTILDASGNPYPLKHNPAAYSWGPWQMMICNARGFTIQEIATDAEKAAVAFVGFFNRFIVGFRKASTLDEIAQTYNSGEFRADPAPGVARYVADALHYYQAIRFDSTEAA